MRKTLPKIEAPWFARLFYACYRICAVLLPRDIGADTLRQIIWHAARRGLLPPCWARLPHGWMYLDATDLPQLFLLAYGEWEPESTAAIRERLRAGDCFVDIGANAGYFSLLAASIVGPEGRVLAFEPNPEVRAILLQNIARNGYRNIEICPACCTDSPGRVKLFLNRSYNSGGCSMSAGNAASNIAIEVDAVRADSGIARLPKPPAIVKIDAEGAEALVLRGMAETLRTQPAIILEIDERLLRGMGSSSEEVRRLLSNYRLEPAGFNSIATARPPDEKAARQSTAAT